MTSNYNPYSTYIYDISLIRIRTVSVYLPVWSAATCAVSINRNQSAKWIYRGGCGKHLTNMYPTDTQCPQAQAQIQIQSRSWSWSSRARACAWCLPWNWFVLCCPANYTVNANFNFIWTTCANTWLDSGCSCSSPSPYSCCCSCHMSATSWLRVQQALLLLLFLLLLPLCIILASILFACQITLPT